MSLVVLNAPMLIAWPSVVAGKAHETQIVYNNKGQPLTVTETGFRPIDATAASADASGVDPGHVTGWAAPGGFDGTLSHDSLLR